MKSITVEELKSWKDKSEDFQLIDVREDYEYEAANINGEHIPMGEIIGSLNKISRDKKVVIHCKSGGRSAAVTTALNQMGFSNVYNLEGGITAWAQRFDPSLMIL
jgi:rhodanese-related sulfurtransferase